jgi:thioredoxin reductase
VYDVIIVGGGPAGLNAALVLGRAQRSVLLCDTAAPRNRGVQASHGFLTRDGTSPAELRRVATDQLGPYSTVEGRQVSVERIEAEGENFRAILADESVVASRRVILATGVTDVLPDVEGLAERWGTSAFDCPYCDGWEVRGQPIVVLGVDEANMRLALMLSRFSNDVAVCTNGVAPSEQDASLMRQRGITVMNATAVRLEGPEGQLERVACGDGTAIEAKYAFCHPPTRQASAIPDQLGLRQLEDGSVEVDDLAQTSVPGVFAAGDMARRPAMPVPGAQIVIAAAEGVVAAVALDQLLFFEELAQLAGTP